MFVFDFLNDWQLATVCLTLQTGGLNAYCFLLTVYSLFDVSNNFSNIKLLCTLSLSLSSQFIKLQNGILASNESKCSYFCLRLSAYIHRKFVVMVNQTQYISKSIKYKKKNFSVLIQIFFK